MFSEDIKQSVLLAAVKGELVDNKADDNAYSLIPEIKNELLNNGRIGSNDDVEYTTQDLPVGWIGIKIKNLVLRDVSYGIVKLGAEDKNGVKVLRCSDVKSGYIDTTNIRTVKKELSDQYKRTILNGGEIVLNIRGTLGGCSIVPDELEGFNIAREVAVIDVPSCLNKQYVIYCLLSPLFWMYMLGNLRGIAYKGLNIGLLKDFVLPIPPITIQNRITDRLKTIFSEIEELETIETRINQLKTSFPYSLWLSILQDAFQGKITERQTNDSSVDDVIRKISEKRGKTIIIQENNNELFSYPTEWRILNLIDVADIYTGDSIPEMEKETKYTGIKEGYNYIGTKDVLTDHTIIYDNGVKIPFDEPNFKKANKDAILLCIEGGSAGKKIAILSEEVCFGNKLCAFNPSVINNKYLFYYLQSPIFLFPFMDKVSGIIGGVSINKIKKLQIPVPSMEEQMRIVDKLDSVIERIDDLIR